MEGSSGIHQQRQGHASANAKSEEKVLPSRLAGSAANMASRNACQSASTAVCTSGDQKVGVKYRKIGHDRMIHAFDKNGAIVHVGAPKVVYRCAMYKCKAPVECLKGSFWHATNTVCTYDETYMDLIERTYDSRSYQIQCSTCPGHLQMGVDVARLSLNARRMPPRHRVLGDMTNEFYRVMVRYDDDGDASTVSRFIGSNGIGLVATLVDVARAKGTQEDPIKCHATRATIQCQTCVNRTKECPNCHSKFTNTNTRHCGKCIVICQNCDDPRVASEMTTDSTCNECAESCRQMLAGGVEVELTDIQLAPFIF